MALTRLGLNQSINLASNVTGTFATGNGGTGATSFSPGKVLQVKKSFLSSNVSQTGASSQADVFSDTITLSSASNYILAEAQLNYQFFGSNSSSTPEFLTLITDGSNNIKAKHQMLDYLKNDSSYTQGGDPLFAFWTPNSTSEQTVKVRMQNPANGRALLFGDSAGATTGKACTMKLMEISA